MMKSPLTLFSLNCRGLNAKIKTKRTLRQILATHVDIVFLQKTHCKSDAAPVFQTPKFSIQLQAPGTSKAWGVAVLFSARLNVRIDKQLMDPSGRFLFLNVHIDEDPFTIASIYGTNDGHFS